MFFQWFIELIRFHFSNRRYIGILADPMAFAFMIAEELCQFERGAAGFPRLFSAHAQLYALYRLVFVGNNRYHWRQVMCGSTTYGRVFEAQYKLHLKYAKKDGRLW
jgi:hypothetical protein